MRIEWPRVSIIMPVYNGGSYFRMALRSALAQDYPDFEIIAVDDGSDDDGEVMRIARGGGPRVKYIRQSNRGVAGALNTGIEAMTGDIFCWLSHDDLFLPDKLRKQANYHQRLGDPDGILFSDYDVIGPAGELLQTVRADRQRLMKAPMLALLTGSINGCTLFAPKAVIKNAGPFEEHYRYVQDYRVWNRVLGNGEFYHQPEVTVQYRVHPEQGSHKPGAITEGDDLWIAMMEDRSEIERVQMYGSALRFYSELARHLEGSPYCRASKHAHKRAQQAISETRVTLIVASGDMSSVRTTMLSLSRQTHAPLETFVVADRCDIDLPTGVAFIRSGRAGASRLEPAILRSRGDYVICVRAGEVLHPQAVETLVSQMQKKGGYWGLISPPADARAALLSRPTLLPYLVFHRLLIGEGWAQRLGEMGYERALAALMRSHQPACLELAS
jgi:glycosyltransferase involved in cell wall biosynthesis